MEKGSMSYADAEETGALIGQEVEVLRIMFEFEYSEDDIDLVRDGFKTKDVFFKRDMDKIKRSLMQKRKRSENIQQDLRALVEKAAEIRRQRRAEFTGTAESSNLVLAYIDRKLNV